MWMWMWIPTLHVRCVYIHSVYSTTFLPTYLPTYLPTLCSLGSHSYLSIYLSIYLSTYQSIYLSIYLYISYTRTPPPSALLCSALLSLLCSMMMHTVCTFFVIMCPRSVGKKIGGCSLISTLPTLYSTPNRLRVVVPTRYLEKRVSKLRRHGHVTVIHG